MKYKNGTEFLDKLYKDMYMSNIEMHTVEGNDYLPEQIDEYLNGLEYVHNIAKTSDYKMDLLKKLYYDKYVVKDLSESYIKSQQRIARERGYGDINVTKVQKKKLLSQIQKEQKISLDKWIDYLCSDDVLYPMWFKYYVFQGMIKLGEYDKENQSFKKRNSTSTEPFLDLNREILAKMYDTISKKIENDELTDEENKALENEESFNELYIYYLKNLESESKYEVTDGIWIKYDRGSDSTELSNSLLGKNTGWCTTGCRTIKNQLSDSDFYVYYTKDENGEYKNPRIAIRINGYDEIIEVKGIAADQNLEENMIDIADKKLDEFDDKEKYKKKIDAMKQLTEIDQKTKKGEELTRDDLIFIYELIDKIEGFIYGKDPRIEEIQKTRDIKKDLSSIYGIDENSIATSLSDFDNEDNNIILYYGDFEYTPGMHLEKLREITGYGNFAKLTFARGLSSLQKIGRGANFENLETAAGLSNLQIIGGHTNFVRLTSIEGLNNLQIIGGCVNFAGLETAEGLDKLQIIEGNAYFNSLKSAKGLDNLRIINGSAYFYSLETAKGLDNLQIINGNAYFYSLETAEGLNSLQIINGAANFEKLETAKGLNNLQKVKGDIDFEELKTAEGLNNLQTIGGCANFHWLKTAKGLNSLQKIGGNAVFPDLETAEGLNNLQTIGGGANFHFLKTAKCLNNLQKIGGSAYFNGLKTAEGLNNLKIIGGDVLLHNLKSAKDLNNLQKIGGSAYFNGLETAEGLNSLQIIGWHAYFNGLETAEGLNSLQIIGGNAYFDNLETNAGLEKCNKYDDIGRNIETIKEPEKQKKKEIVKN